MAKMIAFEQEAREAIRRGISKLSRAVKITLGPKGRNVILQKSFGSPTVTKDGVTVAKEIDLEDVYENIGARMVRWLEESAVVAGIFQVRLEVRETNIGAIRFYNTLGYHRQRTIKDYYSGLENAVRLERDLRPQA